MEGGKTLVSVEVEIGDVFFDLFRELSNSIEGGISILFVIRRG